MIQYLTEKQNELMQEEIMKTEFTNPEMEIVMYDTNIDIITASGDPDPYSEDGEIKP